MNLKDELTSKLHVSLSLSPFIYIIKTFRLLLNEIDILYVDKEKLLVLDLSTGYLLLPFPLHIIYILQNLYVFYQTEQVSVKKSIPLMLYLTFESISKEDKVNHGYIRCVISCNLWWCNHTFTGLYIHLEPTGTKTVLSM